jgi:GWxTD domain-containing protein
VRTAKIFEVFGTFQSGAQDSRQIPILSSTDGLEPGIFGIFRPVLLLPQGLARDLSSGQFESVLAHEMIHVRGRDNLAAALHTIVEAVFWFHPLVWWLGSRLVEERERACDEAVLLLGCDPSDYAEGILRICKSYVTSPACMSGVSGIHLKNRIEAIMENRKALQLTVGKKLLLTIAAAGSIAFPLLSGITGVAQAPAASVQALPATVTATPQAPEPDSVPKQDRQIANPRQNRWPAAVTYTIRASSPPQNRWSAGTTYIIQNASSIPDNWPDEVAYIITDSERKAFTQLTTDAERQAFLASFWLVRDPTPGSPANEFKDEFYARIAFANAHFTTSSGTPGSKTDRGRMYILNGPPDEIVSHPSGGAYYRPGTDRPVNTFPFETWRYRRLNNSSQTDYVIYEFVDSQRNGEYRLEYDPGAKSGRVTEQPATEKTPATSSTR